MRLEGSKWIWCEDHRPNIYCCARGHISLPAPPARGRISVVADSRYQLWVNGEYVGQGPTPFKRPHVFFDSFDVTSRLRVGANVVAILGNYHGAAHCTYTPGPPGILARLEVTDTDGNSRDLATNGNWRVLRLEAYQQDVPRRTWATAWCEYYDARLAPADWQGVGFDDSSWPRACEVAHGSITLQPRMVPPLEEFRAHPVAIAGVWTTESGHFSVRGPSVESGDAAHPGGLTAWLDEEPLVPVDSPASESGRLPWRIEAGDTGLAFTLDFGEELTGHVEIEVNAPAGVVIDLCPTETLRNGRPWCFRKGGEYARRYVTRAGRQQWRCFGYDGLRYLHVVVRGPHPELTFHRLSVWRRQSSLAIRATFKCDDARINRIWGISCHTLRICSQEIHIDCPTREQTVAWGDHIWTGLWAAYMTGDAAPLRHLLLSGEHVQVPDGQLPCYPFSGMPRTAVPLFDFSLIYVWGVWLYMQWSGDVDLATRLAPVCDRVLAWYRREIGPSGLMELNCERSPDGSRGNIFIDHPGWGAHNAPCPGLDRRGINAALNFFFIHALTAQARVLHRLGRTGEAAKLSEEAGHFQRLAHELFFDRQRKVYVDGWFDGRQLRQVSQQTNALAVTAGVCPEELAPSVLTRVLDPDNPELCRSGTYFWTYLAQALGRSDMHREMWSEVVRLWDDMAERGATSWWETFLGDELDSLCHMWSAVPAYLIISEILGVKPAAEGFGEVHVQPRIDLLKQAAGSVPLPQGRIDLSWTTDGENRRRLSVHPQTDLPVWVEPPKGWMIEGQTKRHAAVPSWTESYLRMCRVEDD